MSIPLASTGHYARHSVLCAADTHVFQVGSPTCDCGLWGAATGLYGPLRPSLTKPYPLSGGVIPGYTPHSFAPPRPPTPPTAGQAPPVNIRVFRAAKNAGASHLSADGKTIYVIRMGRVCWADWSEEYGSFGAWWPVEGEIPADAVAM